MTAAVFGLIGVIVGGLVAAGLDYWRTRRAERDEKKAAMRLVLSNSPR